MACVGKFQGKESGFTKGRDPNIEPIVTIMNMGKR